MIQRKLKHWVKQRIEMVPCAAQFTLEHVPEMSEEAAVLARLIVQSGDPDERARELADSLYEQADDHSHAYEGRQRYKLRALDEEAEEIGVYVFALGISGGLSRAEPGDPTERGLLAQLMRHNQLLAQINVEQSQAVNSALMSENRDLRGRVEKVEHQRQEWFELLENLHSARHARELEMAQETARQETRGKAMRLLAQYVPEAIKKLSPGGTAQAAKAIASDPLAEAHEKMRRVWQIIDRDWLLSHMEKPARENVDALLGIGAKVETIEDFSERLRSLWTGLPEDVADELQSQIMTRDTSLALELVQLIGGDEKEAAE
jgi:hypothetical protein